MQEAGDETPDVHLKHLLQRMQTTFRPALRFASAEAGRTDRNGALGVGCEPHRVGRANVASAA